MKNRTKKKAYTEYHIDTNPILGIVVLWIAVGEMTGGFKLLKHLDEEYYLFFSDYWLLKIFIGICILAFGIWIFLQSVNMFLCYTYTFRFRNFKAEREARRHPQYDYNEAIEKGQDNDEQRTQETNSKGD